MIDFWTVFGALATILALAGAAYKVGVARGGAKTKRDLCDERRQNQFSRIYAPAYALFLTRHITTASGRGAPYFRQRFRNAKDVLVDDRKPLQALKSLFDKQELEAGDGVGPSQHTELNWNTPKLAPEIWPISLFLGVK